MNNLQIISLIALLVYFAALLVVVTKEKKNQNVLDYFCGTNASVLGLVDHFRGFMVGSRVGLVYG